MRRFSTQQPAALPLTIILMLTFWLSGGFSRADDKPLGGLNVWDTIAPQTNSPSLADLAGKNGWKAIRQGETGNSFTGDAIISNGRIAVVLDKSRAVLKLHAIRSDNVIPRISLGLKSSSGEKAEVLERASVIENTRSSVALSASFKTASGNAIAATFRLKRGDVTLQVEPGESANLLAVDCQGRFVVLPDFFADDMTIDATRLSLNAVDLPSENFVMHPTGNGDALGLCVFETRQHDTKVHLTGEGNQRHITGSEIQFEGKRIWVGLLEAPHVWHTFDVKPEDAGKIMPLGWKLPYPAQWRIDFSKPGELTDSWEILLQEDKGGDYIKPTWFGRGDDRLPPNRYWWNTVLGDYAYPCWSDPEGNTYIHPLKKKVLTFSGPALAYPINRIKRTPLDSYTVVDVMRNTLGVGPCEHILDVEGQRSEYRGRATCSVRETLNPIYTKKEQIKERDRVNQTLDEGLTFVKHIRGRIERYVTFGQKMREYLAEQQKVHPDCSEFITQMVQLTGQIDARFAARKDKIKTPAHVAEMNEAFRKSVLGYDGSDALDRCKEYTEALVVIGDNQDELSGECRWVVKTLRQRAGVLMAMDPRVAPIALEIRARTQEALRNPAGHEGARH